MKILVVSDSHGMDRNLEDLLEEEKDIDLLIHLGDLEGSEDYIEAVAPCECEMISGNNDFYSDLPCEKVIELNGRRLFLTHGHSYGLYHGLDRLIAEARYREAEIVLFGHTHVPVYEKTDGITVINPGSISLPRQSDRTPTFGILKIPEVGRVEFEIRKKNKKKC